MSFILNFMEICTYQLLRYKTLLLFAAVLCLLIRFMRSRKGRNLPPGPWGLPVLGYLPFLSTQEPHIQLDRLRKKYGDVFGFYLGSKYALFIGDLKKSRDAYNMDEFSGRPDGAFPMSQKITHFAALNGQEWKERRKVTMQALRQLGVGTKMIQDVSRAQIKIAIEKLEAIISSKPNSDINIREIVSHTTTSVVLYFVCGKTFPSEHPNYKIVDKFKGVFAEKGASLSLEIVMPWTKHFISTLTRYGKDTKKIFDDMDNFMRGEIDSHLKSPPETPKDLIDFYVKYSKENGCTDIPTTSFLDEVRESSKGPPNIVYVIDGQCTVNEISGDAQLMIFGGSDTVRATTEWFILCMAEHQEIQKKVFEEIDDFLGPSGEVCYEDRVNLPYTEATILECFRYKGIAPVNPYHSSLEDTLFCGYDIPKDSLVFSLLWTIHNDPAHWSHPNELYPEHFLTSDKSKVQIPEALLPFSPGKRMCAGDKVALIETFLFSVFLIQRFHILPPNGGTQMDGILSITFEARYPVIKLAKRYV